MTTPALVRTSTHGRRAVEDGLRSGTLHRVRRDILCQPAEDDPWWLQRRTLQQAVLDAIVTDGLAGTAVLETAAAIHGAFTWTPVSTVHLAVGYRPHGLDRTSGGRRRARPSSHELSPADRRRALAARPIQRHRFAVDDDVVLVDSIPVTTLERTILDCARFLEPDRGLVVVDSLLAIATGAFRAGPDGRRLSSDRPWDRRAEIDDAAHGVLSRLRSRLDDVGRGRGVRRARAVLGAATPWSQSPYETELRRLCLVHGITEPVPQMPVEAGATTYFVDLGWPGPARGGVEADGDVKLEDEPDAELAHRAVRDEALEAAGVVVAHLRPSEVRDSERAVAVLRELLPQTMCERPQRVDLRTRGERPRRH